MSAAARRAPIACTYCRHRKRRCDGRSPRCRTCRQRGLECVYADIVPQRSDINVADGTQSGHSPRFEAIERLLREHSDAIESLRHGPGIINLDSSVNAPPESNRSVPSRTASVLSPNQLFPSSFWTFNQRGIGLSPQNHPEPDPTPPLTIPLGHKTSTSNLLRLPQLASLIGEYPDEFMFCVEDRRPRSSAARASVLPPHQTAERPIVDGAQYDEYVEAYFELVYSFHPFLDREELLVKYNEIMPRGLGNDNQSALVYAILALGASASDPLDKRRDNYTGDILIQYALRILYTSWTLSFSGDITIAQGLVLCSLYFMYTVEPLLAWRLIHMASTSIQQILARRRDIMPSEIEITRLSWVCFIVESDILAEFHQPRSGIELLVDRMPFPDYGSAPSPENLCVLAEISARSLLNRIHHSVFFTDDLCIYTGKRHETTSMTPPAKPNAGASLLRVCKELDRQLQTWYDSLPQAIKPDLEGNPQGNAQVCLLRLRYWSAKQAIHRPFVVYVTSQSAEHSDNIPQTVLDMCEKCLCACRTFLYTAGHLLEGRTPYTYSTAQFAFSCLLIISMAAQSPHLKPFIDDVGVLQQLTIKLLEPWATTNSSIKSALDIASSIFTKQQFQM